MVFGHGKMGVLKKLCIASQLAVLFVGFLLAGAASASQSEYIIGAGDRLSVFVWGETELSVPALVRPDGRISLPGAGEIMAEGLTPEGLQKEIESRLKALVKDPVVTVSMAEIANSKVYIIGGGVNPGIFELKQKTSLLQLLANMDLTRADLAGAHVMRDGKKIAPDFDSLLHKGDVSQDLALRHNDIVFFPALPEPYVYVLGAVSAPRALAFKDGMTVLDAILETGGFNKFASENDTVVVRRENGVEQRIKVRARDLIDGKDLTQNVLLRRGDYIIANTSFF
ncbi:MAG: polysaccharide biosynthesis/export family protein [Desulfomicrobium apsheronum]|nr:polysaccharide biosynthesis/export family protein [Desulfomicrobium apsheronum]